MIVTDSSVVVPALVDGAGAGALAREALSDGDVHVPHLLDIEVASVRRRLVRAGRLDAETAEDILGDLSELAITRYEHVALLPRIWTLRQNVSAYDASYVALAEVLDATLVTADARLAAAPGLRCDIRLLV